jgi:hypothetical protein
MSEIIPLPDLQIEVISNGEIITKLNHCLAIDFQGNPFGWNLELGKDQILENSATRIDLQVRILCGAQDHPSLFSQDNNPGAIKEIQKQIINILTKPSETNTQSRLKSSRQFFAANYGHLIIEGKPSKIIAPSKLKKQKKELSHNDAISLVQVDYKKMQFTFKGPKRQKLTGNLPKEALDFCQRITNTPIPLSSLFSEDEEISDYFNLTPENLQTCAQQLSAISGTDEAPPTGNTPLQQLFFWF